MWFRVKQQYLVYFSQIYRLCKRKLSAINCHILTIVNILCLGSPIRRQIHSFSGVRTHLHTLQCIYIDKNCDQKLHLKTWKALIFARTVKIARISNCSEYFGGWDRKRQRGKSEMNLRKWKLLLLMPMPLLFYHRNMCSHSLFLHHRWHFSFDHYFVCSSFRCNRIKIKTESVSLRSIFRCVFFSLLFIRKLCVSEIWNIKNDITFQKLFVQSAQLREKKSNFLVGFNVNLYFPFALVFATFINHVLNKMNKKWKYSHSSILLNLYTCKMCRCTLKIHHLYII